MGDVLTQASGSDRGVALYRAAFALTVLTITSTVLGFAREQFTSWYFGASHITDAFITSQTIPNFILQAVTGAFGMTLLPTVTRILEESGEERAGALISVLLTWTCIIGATLACISVVFDSALMRLFISPDNGEVLQLAATAFHFGLPTAVFSFGVVLLRVPHHVARSFMWPALAPIVNNICVVIFIVFFNHWGVFALVWGQMIGSLLQLILVIPYFLRRGAEYGLKARLWSPDVFPLIKAAFPVLFIVLTAQGYVFIERRLALGLGPGFLTSLSIADKVRNMPLGLVIGSIATATFPVFAQNARKPLLLGAVAGKALRLVTIITVPLMVGMWILRTEVITLLFQHGKFSASDSLQTAHLLGVYCLSIMPLAFNAVLLPVFYATQDTVSPLISAGLTAGSNVLLALLLTPSLQADGLVLANTLSAVVAFSFLAFRFSRKLPSVFSTVLDVLYKVVPACVPASGFLILAVVASGMPHLTLVGRLLVIAGGCAAAGTLYVYLMFRFRVEDLDYFAQRLRRRAIRTPGEGKEGTHWKS